MYPISIDARTYIAPLHVPGTFGTYQGIPRPTGTPSAQKAVASMPRVLANVERRTALVSMLTRNVTLAAANASRTTRKIVGAIRP